LKIDRIFGKDPKHLAGIDKEKEIQDILKTGVLSDFVFDNPFNSKTKKEICDILVLFDNTMIIFQVKSTKKPEKHSQKIIKKAINQIKGANRLIQRGELKELNNTRQGKIKFNIGDVKNIINVIIASARDYEYWGSTLRFESGNLYFHLFDDINLKEILNILDTPLDFIEYLVKREEFLNNSIIINASELDLLGLYISSGHKFILPEDDNKPDVVNLFGFWSDENNKMLKNLETRGRLNRISYLYDYLINQAHKCTGENYIKIALEMAKIKRLERRELGRRIYGTGLLSIKNNNDSSGALNFRNSKTVFYILFSNLPREDRKKKLIFMGELTKYKMKGLKVIGVATEIPPPTPIPTPSSFDYYFNEEPWIYDEYLEEYKSAINIQKENIKYTEFGNTIE